MQNIVESKKKHLWRKLVWQTNPDDAPLGPFHYAEVYCCEESNGFAVWYVRRLAKDDRRGVAGVASADYLLDYFSETQRNEAIERAVLIANSHSDVDQLIAALDSLAAAGKKV
ncbi:hypothetical protein [Janthinobacterium sp. 17J80-10]|uniref:hypothetical protein n=1 Tax=Janthinobacterium sp. 17J80-10 TaxID=2497863 RepID=UPI001005560A|nr:hypothetical protein [Janthinobacterium sp. 17J80-10]QAU35275.1 hypothetical protein EKL02_14435 [Janthinobacterium sp. 17J80-10]